MYINKIFTPLFVKDIVNTLIKSVYEVHFGFPK